MDSNSVGGHMDCICSINAGMYSFIIHREELEIHELSEWLDIVQIISIQFKKNQVCASRKFTDVKVCN